MKRRDHYVFWLFWFSAVLACVGFWMLVIVMISSCATTKPDPIARIKRLPQFQILDVATAEKAMIGDPTTIADLRQIGYPCTGNNGVLPIIAPTNLPFAGEVLHLRYNLEYLPREPFESLNAWIWFAFQKDTFMGEPLPLYLGGLGMTDAKANDQTYLPPHYMAEYSRGCRLYIGDGYGYFFPANAEGIFGQFTRVKNFVEAQIMVPNLPALFGLTIYTQMLVESPGANQHGHLTSNAVALTIGRRP